MSGALILISIFIFSLVFSYLVAKFSPNLLVVFIVIFGIQTAGYIWGVSAGKFPGESILEFISILTIAFIWFIIAAQMHLWVNDRTIETKGKQ